MIALPVQQSNIIPFPEKQGKSNEWYTYARYIEAARKVMNSIDLDPASCEKANRTVKAIRYFSEQEDGLSHEWKAQNVWLNPPFGRRNGSGASVIEMFVVKLVQEYEAGNIEQAVLLAPCHIDANWFQFLWKYPICFTNHKVHFHCTRPSDSRHPTAAHMWGTIFVYLGTNEQRFIDTFSKFGHIAKSIAGPRHETVQARLWEVRF